jgi:hypothetical protein
MATHAESGSRERVACVRCGRAVREGEPFWSLDRVQQVIEDGQITVFEATQLVRLCQDCGGTRPAADDFLRDLKTVPPEPGTP